MTAKLHPLMNLRTSLQDYLENPDESSGELYRHAMGALLQIHDTIADFMLSNKDNNVLQRYMRTFQEQIRLLFDDIPYSWVEKMNLLEEENPNDKLNQKYNICYECFRLIREMQLAYPAFFDDTCIPPLMYLVLDKSRHHHNWAVLSRWFNKKRKKYNKIWEIIDTYLEHLWDVNHRFSYGEIAYGFNFVDQLTHNIRARGESFDSKALYSFLIYMNFNDISFLQHITADVREDMDIMMDFEKVALLEDLQQEIESAMVRKDCILDKGNPSISTMLTQWVKRELKDLHN
jgi:hypothetical protein